MTAALLHCGRFRIELTRPRIMGVVNVTPDSFSGDGVAPEAAIAQAQRLIEAGADFVDLGGESTRPGAAPVSEAGELARVLPVLRALRDAPVPVSIDTRRAGVMRAALDAGASMINDIEALRGPGALEAVAASECGVCLMHMQGTPERMQQAPHYEDVVGEVHAFLAARIAAARAAGVDRSRIVADPGFGFGKTLEHNVALLRRLNEFGTLGVPLLAGLSRKSMLGALTGRAVDARLAPSLAAALLALGRGVKILRVHDVAETRDALVLWEAVQTGSA